MIGKQIDCFLLCVNDRLSDTLMCKDERGKLSEFQQISFMCNRDTF